MDETTILVAIACLAVGLVVGSLLTRTLSPQEKKRRDLETRLRAREEELGSYRRDVSDHLLKTSELIRELNQSQRQLGEQLTRSALQLSTPEVCDQVQETAFTGLARDPGTHVLPETPREAPKDYAPGGGTLSEEYGLRESAEPGVTRGIPTVEDVDDDDSVEFPERKSRG